MKPWDKQLLGSWYGVEDGKPSIMVFQENGDFIAKTLIGDLKGKWEVVNQEKRQISSWLRFFEVPEPEAQARKRAVVHEIIISGDKLTMRDLKAGTALEFMRVPDNANLNQLAANLPPPDGAGESAAPAGKTKSDRDADEGKVTAQALRNATADEKKFIEMYVKSFGQLREAAVNFERAIERFDDPVAIVNAVRPGFDASWETQVNHFGTPPRFYDTHTKLRLS